ncbi:MAG: glycosyltransferase [Nitrospira sp.]|nr:glycosyltransferase [Nitrospira sp.]
MTFFQSPMNRASLISAVKSSRLYILGSVIKAAALQARENLGQEILNRALVSLEPKGPPKGYVLLSHVVKAFLLPPGQPIPRDHHHYWVALQMAQTFLDLGYGVDVINFHNKTFWPRRDYALMVDTRWNLERLAPVLNADCIKVLHIDTAHPLFQNAAEARRLLELQQRRGVTLKPWRFEQPHLGIEHADYATMNGNRFSIETFRYAGKRIFPVPVAAPVLYPWPDSKDWAGCRNHFLWINSGGLVLKGLDLILEAFAGMPDCHLTVCGPIKHEKAFEQAYYKELYETPNIHTEGWTDLSSARFMTLAERCVGILSASASEARSGSVIGGMHAGLIPIVNYESGVDVAGFGVLLPNSSVRAIQAAVRRIADSPGDRLQAMARGAWDSARTHHTRERWTEVYRSAIDTIFRLHADKTGASPLVQAPVTPTHHIRSVK